MPIIVQCTSGHRMSVAEEYQGKRVRCPQCQEIVNVAAADEVGQALPDPPRPPAELARHVQAPPPVADRDYETRDRGDWRDDRWDDRRQRDYARRGYLDVERDGAATDAQQLQTTNLGLAFQVVRYFLWVFLILIAAGILTIGLLVDLINRPMNFRDREAWHVLMGIMSIANGILFLVMVIFAFIGSAMCCRAPARYGARGLMLGSVICDGIFLFLNIVILLLALIAAGMRARSDALGFVAAALGVFAILCFVAGQVLAHVGFYRMAHAAGAPRLAGGFMINMVLWLVGSVGGGLAIVGALIMLAASRARDETIGMVMLIVGWSVSILLLLVFIFLIGSLIGLRRRLAAEIQGGRS